MQAIYIYSRKIVNKEILDFFIIADPIAALAGLRKFLLFSSGVDCADGCGLSNCEQNKASVHFTIFGKDKNYFFSQIIWYCNKENIFLLNNADKNELFEKEKVFYNNNKKIKDCLDSLRDDYEMHKANKSIFKMARCIQLAEDIVSGKTKVN